MQVALEWYLLIASLLFVCAELAHVPPPTNTKLLSSGNSAQPGSVWSDCSKDHTLMKIDDITVSPNPPVKGEKVDIKGDFEIYENVTSGEVMLSVMYGKISVVDQTLDLCDLFTQIHKKCPIWAGKLSIHLEVIIPTYLPSGPYSGKITLTDQNGKELSCFNLKLNLN